MSTGNGKGKIAQILDELESDRGTQFSQCMMTIEERFGEDILMAPFLDNHDTDRIANVIGIYDKERLKAAYGMLSMMRGGSYVYYGGEIGMIGQGADPNKRIGMFWTTLPEVTSCPPGTTEAKYPLGSVESQLEDENSLMEYVRRAMNLRNAFPEIARGSTKIIDNEDGDLCVFERAWNGSTIIVVMNLSEKEKSLPITADALIGILDSNVSYTMPKWIN